MGENRRAKTKARGAHFSLWQKTHTPHITHSGTERQERLLRRIGKGISRDELVHAAEEEFAGECADVKCIARRTENAIRGMLREGLATASNGVVRLTTEGQLTVTGSSGSIFTDNTPWKE